MKLRTEIPHTPLNRLIGPRDSIMLLGSCFTEHIGEWLQSSWLDVMYNPWGVLFNPASIALSLQRCTSDDWPQPQMVQRNGRYYSFEHHSCISAESETALLDLIYQTDQRARPYATSADHLLVTWGTAWVYERNGQVVANCHKAPASEFFRRRLSVQEIVEMWSPIVQQRHVVLTVSPIRHIGDGLHGNQVSKATLLLAIEQLQERYPEQVDYLPAYELLNDDLRDYRFYAEDLVHPSPLAIEAVRELFTDCACTQDLQQYLTEARPLVKTLQHRPSDPTSAEYQQLLAQTSARRDQLLAKWGVRR
ncbi:MAG: GSCFA domain-containing protein [Bacteroidales bacterium]|nr:GSCFA domain-containing protein [Bacteroidales bacterium]